MLKKYLVLMLSIVVILFIGTHPTFGVYSVGDSDSVFTVNQDTPLFDYINGKEVIVGELIPNRNYKIEKEDSQYYYVKFGNSTAYIDKFSLAKEKNKSRTILKTEKNQSRTILKTEKNQSLSNTVIITNKQTPVYNTPSLHKKLIGKIEADLRYTVMKKESKHYVINFAGTIGYISENDVTVDNGIPVLMYHHMVPNPSEYYKGNSAVISVDSFKEQMDYLQNNGWITITTKDLELYFDRKINLPSKTVLITFDDGNISTVKYAYPILKNNDFKATSFLIADRITESAPVILDESKLQFVGFKEINETKDVYAYQHHTFGLHVSVDGKPSILGKSYDEIKEDTIRGSEVIGKVFNDSSQIKYMAYPFGASTQEARKAFAESGITMAFTTKPGLVNLGDSRLLLNRQLVGPSDTIESFEAKLN